LTLFKQTKVLVCEDTFTRTHTHTPGDGVGKNLVVYWRRRL